MFSICWWYNHWVIYALYEISIRLLKYFLYNQHIGCFKGQVRQSFLHNYKCGNAYSNSQALLLAKLPVIVPQSNPGVIAHRFLICTHINVMIKYWPINYNLKMSSVQTVLNPLPNASQVVRMERSDNNLITVGIMVPKHDNVCMKSKSFHIMSLLTGIC